MSLFDSFRGHTEISSVVNREDLLSRYKQTRLVCTNLNNKLVQRLSRDELYEGGQRIGVLKNGTLYFDSEDESSVLMDYCIYDVRTNGCNAVEQYLISFPADTESEESVCLRAMQRAIYSLFVVESVERGLGITVLDLRTNEVHLVVDIGFSSTALPGMVFASRLLLLDGFTMTGGAVLPIGVMTPDERANLTRPLLTGVKTDNQGYFDPAPIIRACLSRGCSSRVRYEDPGQGNVQERWQASGRPARVGRNEPCPCGSGRKFKNCCLK